MEELMVNKQLAHLLLLLKMSDLTIIIRINSLWVSFIEEKSLAPLILKWNQQWRCCHQQLLLRTAGLEKGAESTALPLTQQCLKAACGSWISKNHFFFFLKKPNHILPLISQPSQGEYIKKKKSLFPFVIVSWILLLGFHIIISCSALEVKK